MKSSPNVGGVNMRGKKTKLLNCGCCVATDLRQKERDKQVERQMRRLDDMEDEALSHTPSSGDNENE